MAVENVAIELGKLDFEKFCGTGYLLHDAFGLKARFEPDGEPMTEISFEIYAFNLLVSISKDSIPDQVVLKCVRYDTQTGIAVAEQIINGVQDLESDLETCLSACMDGVPNLMTVDEAFLDYGPDGMRQIMQRRYRVMQTKAVEFQGRWDLLEKASSLRIEDPDLYGTGYPCVAIRVLNYAENKGLPGVYSNVGRLALCWDANRQDYMPPEKSILKFLESENSEWLQALFEKAGADSFFELIPMQKFETHAIGLPSGEKKDDQTQYRSVVLDPYGRCICRDKDPAILNGFAESIMLIRRDSLNDPWLARKNIRLDNSGPIAPLAEVQTPNLPDDWDLLLRIRSQQRAELSDKLRN